MVERHMVMITKTWPKDAC